LHSLTIQIPEPIFQSLQQRAKQLGTTPELIAADCLAKSLSDEDALMKWAGAINSQPNGVAERHDHYLGQSLAEDTRQ